MSRPWSDSTKRTVATGMALLLALALYQIRAIIPPLTIAIVIAYILTPIVDALERRTRVHRGLNVLLVDLLALAVLAIIPALAAPTLISQASQLDVDFDAVMENLVEDLASGLNAILGGRLDVDEVLARSQASLEGLLQPLISESVFFLLDVATGLLWAIFVFVVSFYLMRDWHRVTAYLRSVVPPGYAADYASLTAEIGRIWHAFFRGQVILSVVVGTVVAACMALVGVPNALVLGLLAGLLEVVPNVGPVIAATPAVLLALLQGSSWLPLPPLWFALLVAGIYVLIQQVENNYLVPRIIGGSVRLHPLVVLVGAIAGARMAGILGIFLAAPVLASARVLIGYVYAKLLDLDPFPIATGFERAEAEERPSHDWLGELRQRVRYLSEARKGRNAR
ncbi:MAG: AI-2E family transporter [Anaerolineae bacterium]|nr:AI-2E family transporter [Anaerolineae bacterium]